MGHPTRANQKTRPGFGQHFSSPIKARDPRKTTTPFTGIPGQAIKHEKFLARLKALQKVTGPIPKDTESTQSPGIESCSSDAGPDYAGQEPDHIDLGPPDLPDNPEEDTSCAISRRVTPNATAHRLYDAWNGLIRSLVRPFLEYISVSAACVHPPPGDIKSTCNIATCVLKTVDITALFFDHMPSL
jgi:hypothetical protein